MVRVAECEEREAVEKMDEFDSSLNGCQDGKPTSGCVGCSIRSRRRLGSLAKLCERDEQCTLMLGLDPVMDAKQPFERQTLIDNVSPLSRC